MHKVMHVFCVQLAAFFQGNLRLFSFWIIQDSQSVLLLNVCTWSFVADKVCLCCHPVFVNSTVVGCTTASGNAICMSLVGTGYN